MMYLLIGICLGVIGASSRVPNYRWSPLIASTILLVGVGFKFPELTLVTYSEAIYLFVGAYIANALYAGVLWMREDLEPGIGYWGWVKRDMTHPGYLRALHREQNRSFSAEETDQEHRASS